MPKPATSIKPKVLVDAGFASILKNGLLGREDVALFLSDRQDEINIHGKGIISYPHPEYWIEYIHVVVGILDFFIDLDFFFVETPNSADISLYQVPYVDGLDNAIVGNATPVANGWIVQYETTAVKDKGPDIKSVLFDLNTFIHELGHALGLRHPGDMPYSKRYTTTDTAMSYNAPDGNRLSPYFFTKNDINALGAIWGFENDDFDGAALYNDVQFGTPSADRITGTARFDALYGLEGDDTLIAKGDGDYLFGGPGSDSYILDLRGSFTILDAEAGDKVVVYKKKGLKESDLTISQIDGEVSIAWGAQMLASFAQPDSLLSWRVTEKREMLIIDLVSQPI